MIFQNEHCVQECKERHTTKPFCVRHSVISPSTSRLGRADQLVLFKWHNYTSPMETVNASQTKVILKSHQFSFCLPPVLTHSKMPLWCRGKHSLLFIRPSHLLSVYFFSSCHWFFVYYQEKNEDEGLAVEHFALFQCHSAILAIVHGKNDSEPALVFSYHSSLPANSLTHRQSTLQQPKLVPIPLKASHVK